eukprot:gene8552-10272_t
MSVVKFQGSVLVHFEQAPLYGCSVKQQLNDDKEPNKQILFVSGGGGQGDYGVPNVLAALQIRDSTSGTLLARHEDPRGTFSLTACHPTLNIVATAIDGTLFLFKCEHNRFKEIANLAVDKDKEDPMLSAAAFSPDGKWIVTGGSDGTVRLWPFPDLISPISIIMNKQARKLVLSQPDRSLCLFIVSLGISPKSTCVAIICENTPEITLCDVQDSQKRKKLHWRKETHLPRHFQMALIDEMEHYFAIFNARNCKREKSFVVSWNTSLDVIAERAISKIALSALAISSDGKYCAVGDLEGRVTILSSRNLTIITQSKPHVLFITSLAFSTNSDGETSGVISVSADQACLFTSVTPSKGALMH